MIPPGQLARQHPVAAAEIEHVGLARQPGQGPQRARLKAGASLGKGGAEVLIEFAVEPQKSCHNVIVHSGIIRT